MHEHKSRATGMMFTGCLLVGAIFVSSQHPAHGQARDKQGKATLRERGVLESMRAVEVRNKAPGQAMIVFVVPEGTSAKKGDVLVKLDSSVVEEQISGNRLEAARTRAQLKQAEADLESVELDGELKVRAAESALQLANSEKERVLGEGGELAVERATVESEIAVAKARLKTAQFLLERAAADPLRTEELRLSVTEASESLKVAETRLRFLDGPQRKHETIVHDLAVADSVAVLGRHKSHLRRSVEGATAEVNARQAAFDHITRKLDRANDLLRHCQIVAPQDGIVIYPVTQRTRASGSVIALGATVREGQILLRLPDPNRLHLKLYVKKADIDRLRVGQRATIKIDAFPNITSMGKVSEISSTPEPTIRADGDGKRYAVFVALDELPAQAKVGLTALVEITLDGKKTE